VHGAHTLPSAPGLYFAGITVLLAGLLREIGFEAKAIGDAVAAGVGPAPLAPARSEHLPQQE
jgi:hypothetical protein